MKKPLLIIFILLTIASISKAQQVQHSSDSTKSANVSRSPGETIFTAVEQEPAFPGGMRQLVKYFKKNNEQYTSNDGDGQAIVTFVVEKDGSLTDIKVLRNSSNVANTDIIHLLTNCPKWNSGVQNGQPVRVQYTIRLNFYNN